MTLLDFFSGASVINLPERKDRLTAFRRELAAIGMALEPGRMDVFPGVRPDSAGQFPNIGVRGCYLSHLAVLKKAKENRLTSVLVFEDDVTFSPLLRQEADLLLGELMVRTWGFAYLGHTKDLPRSPKERFVEYSGELVTAHCYAVNGPVLPDLVEYLEAVLTRPAGHPEGGPMHLDGAFNMFRSRHPEVVTLLAAPSMASQRPSRSDLSPRWFDSVPVLRQAAHAARWLSDRIRR
jgi:hypothetical protein